MSGVTSAARAGWLLSAGIAAALGVALSIPGLSPDAGARTFLAIALVLGAAIVRFGFAARPRSVASLVLRWPVTLGCGAVVLGAASAWVVQWPWSAQRLMGLRAKETLVGGGLVALVVSWPWRKEPRTAGTLSG
jgi:hypothetical protein